MQQGGKARLEDSQNLRSHLFFFTVTDLNIILIIISCLLSMDGSAQQDNNESHGASETLELAVSTE